MKYLSTAVNICRWLARIVGGLVVVLVLVIAIGEGVPNPTTLTFAFATDEGDCGLLQITGFSDHPPGVKIRYKLVQSAAAKSVR